MAFRKALVLTLSCMAAVGALGLNQQRLGRGPTSNRNIRRAWWRTSWTAGRHDSERWNEPQRISFHRLATDEDDMSHKPTARRWWDTNWTTSKLDSEASELPESAREPQSAREPRFYMDEGLWETWQRKCSQPEDQKDPSDAQADRELLKSMENHTWRVFNPHDADVIVIPVLMSESASGLCGWHRKNMLDLAAYLEKSPEWMKKGGRDHMLPGFHRRVAREMIHEMQPYMRNVTLVTASFDHHLRWNFDKELDSTFDYRRVLIAPYVSAFRQKTLPKPSTFRRWADRPYSVNFVGATKNTSDVSHSLGFNYHGYELRKAAFKLLGEVFEDALLVCPSSHYCDEDLPQCDEDFKPIGCRTGNWPEDYSDRLSNARFGLYTRGDTSSSSYLYDFIDAQAIPIIVDDGFLRNAAPFSSIIDWPNLAIFIPEGEFLADPAFAMLDALNIPEKEMRDKLVRVQQVGRCLSWASGSNNVASILLAEFAFLEASQSSARRLMSHATTCGIKGSL